ncbi:putative enterotoxin [Ophiocordyceps unilateralis]|uniref:Enterotoxin n=1 Tax=Ophiocordyceps unilateralis TaxID=268505 RepID=A0A2A9P5L1_OPHUN|nr:putative enterotoxin [Ophiocordyceps unilateralis]
MKCLSLLAVLLALSPDSSFAAPEGSVKKEYEPRYVFRGERLPKSGVRDPAFLMEHGDGLKSRGYEKLEWRGKPLNLDQLDKLQKKWKLSNKEFKAARPLTVEEFRKGCSLSEHFDFIKDTPKYTQYISTAVDPRVASRYARLDDRFSANLEDGVVYKIAVDGKMIHLQDSLSVKVLSPEKVEFTVPGHIPASQIEGWWMMKPSELKLLSEEALEKMYKGMKDGSHPGFIKNKYFKPEKYLVESVNRDSGAQYQLAGFPDHVSKRRQAKYAQFQDQEVEANLKMFRKKVSKPSSKFGFGKKSMDHAAKPVEMPCGSGGKAKRASLCVPEREKKRLLDDIETEEATISEDWTARILGSDEKEVAKMVEAEAKADDLLLPVTGKAGEQVSPGEGVVGSKPAGKGPGVETSVEAISEKELESLTIKMADEEFARLLAQHRLTEMTRKVGLTAKQLAAKLRGYSSLNGSFKKALKSLGKGALTVGALGYYVHDVIQVFKDTSSTGFDIVEVGTSIVPFLGCATQAANDVYKGTFDTLDAIDKRVCLFGDALLWSGNPIAMVFGVLIHLGRFLVKSWLPSLDDELKKNSKMLEMASNVEPLRKHRNQQWALHKAIATEQLASHNFSIHLKGMFEMQTASLLFSLSQARGAVNASQVLVQKASPGTVLELPSDARKTLYETCSKIALNKKELGETVTALAQATMNQTSFDDTFFSDFSKRLNVVNNRERGAFSGRNYATDDQVKRNFAQVRKSSLRKGQKRIEYIINQHLVQLHVPNCAPNQQDSAPKTLGEEADEEEMENAAVYLEQCTGPEFCPDHKAGKRVKAAKTLLTNRCQLLVTTCVNPSHYCGGADDNDSAKKSATLKCLAKKLRQDVGDPTRNLGKASQPEEVGESEPEEEWEEFPHPSLIHLPPGWEHSDSSRHEQHEASLDRGYHDPPTWLSPSLVNFLSRRKGYSASRGGLEGITS